METDDLGFYKELTEKVAFIKGKWYALIEEEGGDCPVCDRWGKMYRRGLNSAMARGLLWLVQQGDGRGDGWIDVPETAPRWMLRSPQFPSLRYWGLVQTMTSEKHSKLKSTGLWKVTDQGRLFALRRSMVTKYVNVYNDTPFSFEGDQVYIDDCLGHKYNYAELTKGNFYDDTRSESEEESEDYLR